MAATSSTQTANTAASSASPAAGATTSTAGNSATTTSQRSETEGSLRDTLAAELAGGVAKPGTGGDQAKRGTNAASTNDQGQVNGQTSTGAEGAEAGNGEGDGGGDGEGAGDGNGEGEGDAGTGDGTGDAGGDGSGEGDGAGEGEAGDSTVELPEEIDPEKPPKGMEKVPKSVWKRLEAQGKQIKELKAEQAAAAQNVIKIAPTAASPLADVEDVKGLEARLASAKAVRDYVKENPDSLNDGAKIKRADGSTIELTAEQVKARHAQAEREIEAGPDARTRLKEREQSKPWETARQIAPDLFKKGTDDNAFLLTTLKEVPQIKQMEDWEVFLACASRGYRQMIEEQSGKAKYVRHELDEGGNVIPPKAKATVTNGKPKPKAPGATKPPLRAANQNRISADDALAALPQDATPEQRARTALVAELGG